MGKRLLCFACIAMVFLRVNADPLSLENRLADHPSPYLAMHGDDPVHWQVWGSETLQLAKKLNRPLFVSSGYFSCHWCHVMQRESYQDPVLAKLLNTHFVPVKLDRELEPALDGHLIDFVKLTRGHAGWPLNVFLTPEGYPMLGMTYLPRDRFLSVVQQLRDRWQAEPDELRRIAEQALSEWQGMHNSVPGPAPPGTAITANFMNHASELMDELSGGFGEQSKFPMTAQLMALLSIREQVEDRGAVDAFLRLTLDKMESQGMHDLVGGGFFRYVVDPDWQTPHYEKMLYDNAQLVSLYLRAAGDLNEKRYRDTALETLDFMLREMWRGEYFISSFSAVDGEGREGAYYLWNDAELKALLSKEELQLAATMWFERGVASSAWGKLPRWQIDKAGVSESRADGIRKKLLKARALRSLPADIKGLAAWNGLALTALADAVEAGGDDMYRRRGNELASYLATKLWDGKRLARALDGGSVLADGSLQDYALVAKGLQDWARASNEKKHARLAGRLTRIAWQRFYRNGRWVVTDAPLIPMLDGELALEDNPLPSATALIMATSFTNQELKQNIKIHNAAKAHLEQVRTRLSDAVFWYASYVEWLVRE